MDSFQVALLATILVLAEAGSIYKPRKTDEGACAHQCSDNKKFNYQTGTVYEFSYDAKTTTRMNGASEDSAAIYINAKVEIEPLTKCDLVMRITDASLRDSEGDQNSQAFKEAMMKQSLKFSFQDGRIDHICAMDGESTWTLNIKRGILSAFQNSMDNFDRNQNLTETDVVGTCRSEYKVISNGRKSERIEKTKNLLGCSDREGYRLAVQSIGYNVPSFVKSLPLMKSEYKCTQTLDLGSNILQSSTCSEEHVFRPFSSGNNGAMTKNIQTLTFDKTKKAGRVYNDKFDRRTSLLFEHQFDIDSRQEREGKVEEKLGELCQFASEDVRPELPEMINQLAATMREVNADVFTRVYNKITRPNFCPKHTEAIKQYFLDAIPMVGTVASVKAMEEFISKKYVTGGDVDMWLWSLSFIQRPSREMVAAVTPLLDVQNLTENAMLTVSSLASGYCNTRPDCGKDAEISALITKLLEFVNDCKPENDDTSKIVSALRALGNIGRSIEPVSRLSRCLANRDVPAEIRVAAIDAFRRIPCEAKRSDLMGVFRDASEDSELRINAYIGLMKCPSRNILSEVRQVLEKEKSNQVGSFVWSHLTNLMETSDPHLQDIRNIVQDEELKKEFNLDQRKFSRNYEGSFFFDAINTGAKVDSNVIFSEKSFIPRSANLNLTIDLFGQAINFLEFGGRVQGFERMLEKRYNYYSRRVKEKPAGLGILKNKNNFGQTDQFSASTYLRVFGNELRYWDTTKFNEINNPIIDLLSDNNVELNKTVSLLTDGVVIPTCIGLPLNLTLTATGSVDFKRSRDTIKHDYPRVYRLKLTPSAALQIKGEMTVDAHLSKAGLKMVTVAHTSTAVILTLAWSKVSVEFPKAKSEFFNIKSDFFIVQRNVEKKQKMLNKNMKKFTVCSGSTMKSGIGLSLCQHVQFSNASFNGQAPYFPFTGPAIYDLYMRNDDAPNGFVMTVNSGNRQLSFDFDTPGSKISRRVTLNVERVNRTTQVTIAAPWRNFRFKGTLNSYYDALQLGGRVSLNNKNYSMFAQLECNEKSHVLTIKPYLALKSPTRNMLFNGSVVYDHKKILKVHMNSKGFGPKEIDLKVSSQILPEEISATSSLTIGKNEYAMVSRVGRLRQGSTFQYNPYFKISLPSKELVEVTSELTYDPFKKFTFDFKLDKLLSRPVTLNEESNTAVSKPITSTSLNGVDLDILQQKANVIRFSSVASIPVFAAHNAGKGKNMVKVQFKAPRGNFRVIGDFSKKKSAMSGRVITSYAFGPRYSDRLTVSGKLRDLSLKNSARYLGSVELSSKKKVFLNFKLNGQLAKTTNHMETKFNLQYGNPKNKAQNTVAFSAVVNRSLKTFIHAYSYTMAIQHAGQNLDYKMEANHVQSAKWPFKKFVNNVMVQMAPGKVIKTKLSYNNAKVKGLPTSESEIALSYPGRDMKMADKLTQVNRNTYENHFTVQWQQGREATVKSTYTKTGKYVHDIENTLRLPNKKEAKASAMMQVTPGSYKARLQFSAEANSVAERNILYVAEARLRNSRAGKQLSSVLSIDASWSPLKKFSANIGTVQTDSSLSNKMVFTTPFTSLKTLESEAKYAWNNGKYSSLMRVSWNKKNEYRQEMSITHPGKDLELNYLVSSDVAGKKSFLKYAITKTGPKASLMAKMESSNSPVFNLMLSHTNAKKQRKTVGSFSFNVLGTDADFKMAHTGYPLKDETISSGEGNIKFPFENLKEIGASYSLKHNMRTSSINIDYSSSLKNFVNGKLTAEISRALPGTLEAKMKFTQMDKAILGIDARYKGKVDEYNIDINIIDPRGEKITALANIDLSGPRKTSSFKIESKYVNLVTNGAFEYKNGRFIDGEMKILANGKNLKMSANYEKDRAGHKLTGHLELPDGRTINGKVGLMLQDIFSVSLFVDSPEFPSLTNIDIDLVCSGDFDSVVTKGYVKILPYLKQSEFETSVSTKENINLALMLKTPYGSMRSVKATVSLQRNLEKIKSEFELNKNKVMELEVSYMFKSIKRFSASLDLKTSHRRLDVVSVFLKHSGDLFDMESVLKAKVGQEMKLFGKLSNSPSNNEITLKGEFKDFDDFEASFTRIGFLNDMQATMFYKLEKRDQFRSKLFIRGHGAIINAMVTIADFIDFELKSELDMENISYNLRSNMELQHEEIYKIVATYEHLAKLSIKTSFPSYKDELTMTLNGDFKMFNALAKLTHNTNKYELIISNQGYYRKIDAQLITPLFTDMASFIFNGDEETFNAQAKFMHANDQYELVVSNRKQYKQLTITLSTPFSSDRLDIDSEGDLSSFKSLLTFTHNKVEYSLKLAVDGYYRNVNAKVMTPTTEVELLFTLEGDIQSFDLVAEFAFNKKHNKLTISNKDYYREMSIKLVTPYTNDSIYFVLDGDPNSFNAKLKYMSFKKLYELVVHNSGYYREIEAKLSTPYFRDMFSISVDGKPSDFTVQLKVMHNHNNYQMTVARSRQNRKLTIELTTPSYEGSIDFSLKGSLPSFVLVTKVRHNNDKFQLSVTTVNYYRQINAELLTPYFKESVDFLFNGTLRKFNTQLTLKHNRIVYEFKASNREFYREINMQLLTPFFFVDIQFEGTMQAVKMDGKLNIGKATYECQMSAKKYFQFTELKLTIPKHTLVVKSNVYYKKKSITGDASATFDGKKFLLDGIYKDTGRKKIIKADLKTPYFVENLQGSIAGTLRKFNANIKLQHNKYIYEMIASNKNYYDELDLRIKAPGMIGKFQSEGDLEKCKVSASLKMASHLYEMTLTNQNYLRNITLEVSSPQTGKCKFTYVMIFGWDTLRAESTFSHGNTDYKLNVSMDGNILKYEFSAPQINVNGQYDGDLKSFSFNANVVLRNEKYEMMASTKNYFREISAKMATPQIGEQSLSMKINGQLSDFSGFIEVKNNNEVYRSDFSLANNEFRISLPKLLKKLQVKLNGNWKNFEFVMQLMDYSGKRIEISADKNFKELKAHAVIPKLRDIYVFVKTSGNLRNGAASMKMSYGENIFENEIEISFDGSQASFKLEPHYKILGRSGKSKLKIDLMFEAQSYKYEFEADIEGTQVKSMASMDISSEAKVYSFDLKCDYDNSQNKIEIKGDLKFQGVKTIATLSAITPFRRLKEFFIAVQTKMLRDGPSVELDVKVPNQEYSLNIDLSNSDFNALLNVNMDKKNKDKQYQFQTSYKNTDQRADVSRSFTIKIVLPDGTVSLESHFADTERSLLASSFLLWDGVKHHKIGVELEFQKGNTKSIKCKLSTPRRNVELFGSYSEKDNQNTIAGYAMFDADRSPQKIEVKADVIDYSNGKTIDLLIKFPNQKNGMRMKYVLTGPEGQNIFSGKAEISIDQDPARTLTVEAKLGVQQQNYSLVLSAVHPSSDFSARLITFLAAEPDSFASGIDLQYSDIKKQQQNFTIRGEIFKLKKEFNLKMQTPSKKMALSGFLKTDDRIVMVVKKSESDKGDMEAAVVVDPNAWDIRMDINYDRDNPSKVYRLDAVAQDNGAMLKAYRMVGKKHRVTDTRILVELRPSHILYLSLRWNPNMLRDLNRSLYEKLRKFGAEARTFGIEVSEVVSEELLRRIEVSRRSLMADLSPVLQYFETEQESLFRDVSRYVRNFKELYKNNNFYVKTIQDGWRRVWENIWMDYITMVYTMSAKIDEYNDFLSKRMVEMSREFDILYGKTHQLLMKKMIGLYDSLSDYVRNVQGYYFSMFHDILYSMKADLIDIIEGIPDTFKEFLDDFQYHPSGARIFTFWSGIGDSIDSKTSQLNTAMSSVGRHLNSFRYIRAVDIMLEMSNEAYQQMVWAYRYWNVKSSLLNIKNRIKDSFYLKLNELKTSFTDFDMDAIVFDPKHGNIVVEFRYATAMHVYNLVHAFVETVKNTQVAITNYRVVMPERDFNFWDFYYVLRPFARPSKWIPISKAHATLYAGQHITTFDGHHFDYKGNCSYLMTRDFVDGNFTVVANYDTDRSRRTIKSITVTTAINNEIEIFSDYKVKFQGEYTDLPIQMKGSFMIRRGDQIILKSSRGYEVTADPRLGLYTVEISGWYFNKVAGMFGTYNNEQNDDMTMYNMNQTDDVEAFAASWWTASSVCKSHSSLAPTRTPQNRECYNYFAANNSPFRNCFYQVKPDDFFYHTCNALSHNSYNTGPAVCDVSAFYLSECRKMEVNLEMPKHCVSCRSTTGNTFLQTDTMLLASDQVPAAADVIFVVEERKCNSMVGTRLPEIVQHITSILAQKGLHDSRFGLIGFGAYYQQRNYIHTSEGKMMSSSELMTRSLEKLTYPGRSAHIDVMKAVMRATEYPFRAGVRKTIILVTCTGCHENDVTTWELEQMLNEYDITLHVLADHDFKTKGNPSTKTTYLYGADKSHAYSKEILDAEMEMNIVIPEDNCVQLALESNGSYFDSKKLENGSASVPFMESFAERISESLMPTNCQRCHCVPDERGIGQSICKTCSKNVDNQYAGNTIKQFPS